MNQQQLINTLNSQTLTADQIVAINAIINPVKKQTLKIQINESEKRAAIESINVDAIAKREDAKKISAMRRYNKLLALPVRNEKQQARLEKLAREYALAI